jgi:drug/metabolite transporter (DMT)-like permease
MAALPSHAVSVMNRISPALLVAALLAVLSMSLVPLLIRTTQADPYVIGIVRLAVALLALSPFVLNRHRVRSVALLQWGLLALVGILFGLHWLTYFISIKASTASIAALSISTYGIHLLLLNWLILGQRITLAEWGAILACCGGCVLVVPSLRLDDTMTQGMLSGILSGFLYACLPLLHQRLRTVPTMMRAWAQFAFALLIFVPLLPRAQWSVLTWDDWWRLLTLGAVCTLIGHSLWVKVSTELPAVLTGVIYYLYVPIAMVGSFYWLDEDMGETKILGAALIFGANIATALLSWRKHRMADPIRQNSLSP